MRPISYYSIDHHFNPEFGVGQTVLDVGAGGGRHLRKLQECGSRGIGLDVDLESLKVCREQGWPVMMGSAERLPVADRSCDGVICYVTLPYTDEAVAVQEWARVLKPGGKVITCLHGLGYAARQAVTGPGSRGRIYGMRTIANSWVYRLSGRRLPGGLGDTLYQSRSRMARYYKRVGFKVTREVISPAFMGMPVFILHELQRIGM